MILSLEPERRKNRLATTRERSPEMEGLFRDAQAACDFSCFGVEVLSFFHSVSVMAAILRARVRRAIVGLHALGQQQQIEILERSGPTLALVAAPLNRSFHIVVVILIQTTNVMRLFRASQLAFDEAVFRTVAGLNASPL